MNSIPRQIIKLLYKYGNAENKFLIPLGNVWIHYSSGNLNVYVENKKVYIKTELGYTYSLVQLDGSEQYSILCALELYIEEYEKMLNNDFKEELDF